MRRFGTLQHHRLTHPAISTGVDQRDQQGYRRDIDGLRALAVLPIVAFHLGFQRIPGGFVGVDVFFVVSGYLIGGQVLNQLREHRYTAADFYLRRFRRIMPALVVMLSVSTLAVCALFLPAANRDYASSLAATALFGSNFWYWSTSNYFSAEAYSSPLLHTWSLAVEEQFYVVFPLIIALCGQLPYRTLFFVLAGLGLTSLAFSVALLPHFPSLVFYLLPGRMWEFLLGVLALSVPGRFLATRVVREVLAPCGLALVGLPMLIYTGSTPFPGIAACIPCLGTAILLAVGQNGGSWVSRMLGLRPLVFIGLISYSLYLWHWPVIVLVMQGLPTPFLTMPQRLAVLALSLALAYASWRWVERPWRAPTIPARRIYACSAVSLGLLALTGLTINRLQGLPFRFDRQTVAIAAIANDPGRNDFRSGRCFIWADDSSHGFDRAHCLRLDPHRPNILLVGDSHAAHLWSGLQDRFPAVNWLQATASGCLAIVHRRAGDNSRCGELMNFIFGQYLAGHPVGTVVVAGNWGAGDENDVAETIDWLRSRGYRVVLAGPIVRYRLALPQLIALGRIHHDAHLVDRLRESDGAKLDADYGRIGRDHGAIYWSTYQALCAADTCQTADSAGLPLQFDYGHLTHSGSVMVADTLPRVALRLPPHESTERPN